MQSQFWDLQDSFIAEGSESGCVLHFYESKGYFCPIKCHIVILSLLCFSKAKGISLLFQCEVVALILILALLLIFLPPEFVYLSHLDPLLFQAVIFLPMGELLNADCKEPSLLCAMRASPTANWRLAQVPKIQFVCVCNVLEHLSNQDYFYNPMIAPCLVGSVC